MDWTAFSAIASAVSGVFVAISIVVLVRQVSEAQKATHAQTFFAASATLQNEEMRRARGLLFSKKDKPIEEPWTTEEIAAAERVCQSYDTVGIMVRNKMLPKKILIDSWGYSLRSLWPIVLPLVQKYREERDASEFWNDFEWLADEAVKFDERNRAALLKRKKRQAILPHRQSSILTSTVSQSKEGTTQGENKSVQQGVATDVNAPKNTR